MIQAIYAILFIASVSLQVSCDHRKAASGDSQIEDRVKSDPGKKTFQPSDFPNVPNTLFGGWSADEAKFDKGGVARFISVYFNSKNEMGVSLTCMGNKSSVTISATVDAWLGPQQIVLDHSLQLSAPQSSPLESCHLTLDNKIFDFRVSGDQLQLRMSGEKSFDRYSRLQ